MLHSHVEGMALDVPKYLRATNSGVYRVLPRVTETIRGRRLRLAGHIERHNELIARDPLRDPDQPRFYLAYSAIPRIFKKLSCNYMEILKANYAIPRRPRLIRVPGPPARKSRVWTPKDLLHRRAEEGYRTRGP